MTLTFLAFGPARHNHLQANFAILTHLSAPGPLRRVVVLTDAPQYYRFATDERVIVEVLEPARLAEWRGPHDFFWRSKICALGEVARRYPGEHVVYTDADTFRFGNLADLAAGLDAGRGFMHAREGRLAELPTKLERRMWQACGSNVYGGVTVGARSVMFNAGVVALPHPRAAEVVELALAICDDMCAAGVPTRLVEQFALSLALAERTGVATANHLIAHYWGNKAGWDPLINDFFLTHHLRGSDYAEQLRAVAEVDLRAVPVYTKSSGTQRRLGKLVNRWFDKKHGVYVPAPGAPVDGRSERWLPPHQP